MHAKNKLNFNNFYNPEIPGLRVAESRDWKIVRDRIRDPGIVITNQINQKAKSRAFSLTLGRNCKNHYI